MTRSYQYINSLPRTRRKLNARFVHQLKKLCGGCYGIHVSEVFNDDDMGDYAFIFVVNSDLSDTIIKRVKDLCTRYGIGSNYINIFDGDAVDSEGKDIEGNYVHIHLSQPVNAD